MGLGCRVKEDLVTQNHSTLSIIKHLQISFPTKGHQVTKNPVRCAGEVDPQMAHGICQWLWSWLGPSCQTKCVPQFPVGVAAGLSRVWDLELSEDQDNDCSTGTGVKGGLKRFFFLFVFVFSSLSQSCTCTLSMMSTDIAKGYSWTKFTYNWARCRHATSSAFLHLISLSCSLLERRKQKRTCCLSKKW